MKLQVLAVTMGQSDLSLAEKMNLQCDAVIANQHDVNFVTTERFEYGTVKMITTDTRGVGVNRNIGLLASEADIFLFADDDVAYYDGSSDGVIEAFRSLPDADVIFFGMDMTRNGEIFERRRYPVKRLRLYKALRFGTARMAIRKDALVKHNLTFSTLFGGGCIYSSGEDSLFIRDCFKAGLNVYSHSHVLGKCAKDGSTWFSGYNEKYVYDKGALLACAFPMAKHIVKWHFIRKFAKKTGFSVKKTARLMNRGIRGFKNLTPFEGI